MITRMEIQYRTKEKHLEPPDIFSTGGYSFEYSTDGDVATFDFEDMEGYNQYDDFGNFFGINVIQKNLDRGYSVPEDIDALLMLVKKEDFVEIAYECYIGDVPDSPKGYRGFIEMTVESMTFFGNNKGEQYEFEVEGTSFIKPSLV